MIMMNIIDNSANDCKSKTPSKFANLQKNKNIKETRLLTYQVCLSRFSSSTVKG